MLIEAQRTRQRTEYDLEIMKELDVCIVKEHYSRIFVFFFFQAEDGIRDLTVTGVQTCALPIFYTRLNAALDAAGFDRFVEDLCRRFYAPVMGRPSLEPGRYFRLLLVGYFEGQIGRASCRERV